MKRNIVFSLILVSSLGILPGCGNVVDWGKKQINQGKDVHPDLGTAKSFVRSERIYDQFELVGSFDGLWLTDPVRVAYANFYSFKRGKDEDQKKVFLRRQLEENNYFISFYVLSLKSCRLGEYDSKWALFLNVGDKNYSPVEIRIVDLSPEYKDIFGKKYNNFKDAYLVFFNAKNVEDNYIIPEKAKDINLVLRSVNKEANLRWEIA